MNLQAVAHGVRVLNEALETVAYTGLYYKAKREKPDAADYLMPAVIALTITTIADTIFLGMRFMGCYFSGLGVFLILPRAITITYVGAVQSPIAKATASSQGCVLMENIVHVHEFSEKFPNASHYMRTGLTLAEMGIRAYSITKLLTNKPQQAQN